VTTGPGKRQFWLEPAFVVGVLLTILVIGTFLLLMFEFPVETGGKEFSSKWNYLKAAPPNEIGDSLAGFAGSLAFIWIVVTVWLQAQELREQRIEFSKMADAQSAQVDILQKQGEIFQEEQKQRREDKTKEELNQLVATLISGTSEVAHGVGLVVEKGNYLKRIPQGMVHPAGHQRQIRFLTGVDYSAEDEALLSDIASALDYGVYLIEELNSFRESVIAMSYGARTCEKLAVICRRIISLENRLSEAERVRLERLKVTKIEGNLVKLAGELSP